MIDELVESISTSLNVIQSIIGVNYAVVTTILTTLCSFFNGLYLLCQTIYTLIANVVLVVCDFITEIWNILLTIGSFLTWIIGRLFSILNGTLYMIEQCFVNLYFSILSTISLIIQLVTCTTSFTGTVLNYIFSIVAAIVSSVYNALVFIGNCVTQGMSNTLVFTITNILNTVSSTFSAIKCAWAFLYQNIWNCIDFINNIPTDVYIGVFVLIILFYSLNSLFRYMYHHGMTFPPLMFSQSHNVDDNLEAIRRDDEDDSVDDEDQQDPEDDTDDDEHEWDDIDVDLPDFNKMRHEATPSPGIMDPETSKTQLKNALEKERDQRLCVVCQHQKKTVLVMPCKHLCLCVKCAHQILALDFLHRRVCPLCRANIETIMNVYV